MADFLALSRSFDFSDYQRDRNQDITDLNEAIITSNKIKDRKFYSSRFFEETELSGKFFQTLWKYSSNNGYVDFKRDFPWINQLEYQALFNFPNFFSSSPNNSNDLKQLNVSTGEICSWIGFFLEISEELIYDKQSLITFHNKIAANFSRQQRLVHPEYFRDYYIPKLKFSLNQINDEIKKGKYHQMFLRIDAPSIDPNGQTLHQEKIQMHFKDNKSSALNIDGTWKHGSFELNEDVCEQLVSFGFILPENII